MVLVFLPNSFRSPIEDGVELTASPRDLLSTSGFAPNVTVAMGTNADEGSEFTDVDYDGTEQEYEDYLLQVNTPTTTTTITTATISA